MNNNNNNNNKNYSYNNKIKENQPSINSNEDIEKCNLPKKTFNTEENRALLGNQIKKGDKKKIIFGTVAVAIVATLLLTYFIVRYHQRPNHIIALPTIIISIDSFRPEYLERGLTPNLQNFIDDNSFKAQFTTAQFPSKTFPNHYSIATGLYPQEHGIVSNEMFDPKTGKIFNIAEEDSLDPSWWWGEPIWVTANKSQIKTACYFWPGCSARINGSPDYNAYPFDWGIPTSEILNQVYQWRKYGGDNKTTSTIPTLTMGYIHEIDDAGHSYGPDSEKVDASISSVDKSIGVLIDQLKSSGLYDKTNIIFTSDHGMMETPTSKYIYLDDLTNDEYFSTKFFTPDAINNKGYSVPSPLISIFPNDTKNNGGYIDFYKKDEIPKEYFYNSKSNSRIPPILGVAKPGYSIIVNKETIPFNTKQGNHGYDPSHNEMHSIFIARGPNIKSSGAEDTETTTTLKSFKNIEIYNLLAKLMGIESKHFAPNNGTSLLIDNLYIAPKIQTKK
ncbi:hypothetical protein DICPUDRAFT_39462 [Dictyostelium purpureum]|uniref:Uncharacterized protein n=1 Tax=Dictyostelium purpureum TaxID=5786 RepID=F0ZWD6_DICPU|nr:uncharacterized protein DICPUDRAFT_39462 [Dictyostelium purpureum]EGC31745.1 hypothetical protein DICPUDRAFT_39462 [Dictyostelium purpureum]|eukprot:XP_003291725.1 hypothetical protein DICPUDRAFT_39462 [Dictyostelium purpureum]